MGLGKASDPTLAQDLDGAVEPEAAVVDAHGGDDAKHPIDDLAAFFQV
jgi:hypothetical protein